VESQGVIVDRMMVKATTTIRRSDFEMDSLSNWSMTASGSA
jgi:polyisoprenoid-binding protein YceI